MRMETKMAVVACSSENTQRLSFWLKRHEPRDEVEKS
jgi:hypothetical protein